MLVAWGMVVLVAEVLVSMVPGWEAEWAQKALARIYSCNLIVCACQWEKRCIFSERCSCNEQAREQEKAVAEQGKVGAGGSDECICSPPLGNSEAHCCNLCCTTYQ